MWLVCVHLFYIFGSPLAQFKSDRLIYRMLEGKNCLGHINPRSPEALQCLVATVLSLQIVHVRHLWCQGATRV
ncbi:hypothetical protein BKA83DRAFT_4314350 [Pisolithus microcarpus]|nr:hypothetical protein BKA83DRAFT_4314350 [Pisolithus microcarpus]